jgi:hypothetical protein
MRVDAATLSAKYETVRGGMQEAFVHRSMGVTTWIINHNNSYDTGCPIESLAFAWNHHYRKP